MHLFQLIGRRPKAVITASALLLVLGLGALDYATGVEVGFSVFYLVPVSAAAWHVGKGAGALTATFGAAVWLTADMIQTHYSHPAIGLWNAVVRLAFFQVVSYLLARLRALNEGLEARVRDRTAELAAEVAQHRRTARLLRESEERLGSVLSGAPLVLWAVDREGTCVLVKGSRSFGPIRDPEKAVGQPFAELVEGRADMREQVDRALAGEDVEAEVVFDGHVYDVRQSPIRDPNGDIVGAIGVANDITERKRAEEALREHRAQFLAARTIQQVILPTASPALPGFDIAGASVPAQDVGGDFFDYIPLSNGRLGISVGDVSGHGLAAAIVMALARAYLRSAVLTQIDIGQILSFANRAMFADTGSDMFVTLMYVCLDPTGRELVYVGAGHPAGYVLDSDRDVRAVLASTAIPLGIQSRVTYATQPAVALSPGDVIVLLTDGLTEATSPQNELFGMDRVLDTVRRNLRGTAGEILDALQTEVHTFCEGRPQNDDMTAVVVRVGDLG